MNHVETIATPYMACVRVTFAPKDGVGESLVLILPVKPDEVAHVDAMAFEFEERLAEALEVNERFGQHPEFKPGNHTVAWAFVEQMGWDAQDQFVTSGLIRALPWSTEAC